MVALESSLLQLNVLPHDGVREQFALKIAKIFLVRLLRHSRGVCYEIASFLAMAWPSYRRPICCICVSCAVFVGFYLLAFIS